eukprot:COSAG03_NODE_28643_length_195_cov_206.479167_1_plen_46_part_01
MRTVKRGYPLARLRWSAHRVTDTVNATGQIGRQQRALTTFSKVALS